MNGVDPGPIIYWRAIHAEQGVCAYVGFSASSENGRQKVLMVHAPPLVKKLATHASLEG